MKTLERTEWFDGMIVPELPGVYERKRTGSTIFSRWDGNRWYVGEAFPDNAACSTAVSNLQSLPWRGHTGKIV
jgi:hypothetical protein